jgi:hypothetical protein
MENINWSENVTNDEVFERLAEKGTLLNNIMRRKTSSTDRTLRINSLLHDAIEGQMKVAKGVGRRKYGFEALDFISNANDKIAPVKMSVSDNSICKKTHTYLINF